MSKRMVLFALLLLALAGLTLTTVAQDPPVDQLAVVSVQTLELQTAIQGKGTFLAPNGEAIAILNRKEVCLYTLEEEEKWCTDIGEQRIGVDPETVRWSPDSRYLVFSADFFLRFYDSDIWLLDAETGEVSDLTDDGSDKIDIFGDNWDMVDVLPRWTGDGKAIIFLRYRSENRQPLPPDIYAIAPDGSGLKPLGSLRTVDPFPTTVLAVSPAGFKLAYNHNPPAEQYVWNGAWVSDLDGRNGTVVAAGKEYPDIPTALEFSADNRYLMLYTEVDPSLPPKDPANSRPEIIDLDSFERLALAEEHYVSGAGWSPEGAALAYIIADEQGDASGLYLAAAPGEPGRLVLPGLFVLPTPRQQQMITWAANNTLLLVALPDFKVTLIQLG